MIVATWHILGLTLVFGAHALVFYFDFVFVKVITTQAIKVVFVISLSEYFDLNVAFKLLLCYKRIKQVLDMPCPCQIQSSSFKSSFLGCS